MPALGSLNDATAATAAGQHQGTPMPVAIDASVTVEVPDVIPDDLMNPAAASSPNRTYRCRGRGSTWPSCSDSGARCTCWCGGCAGRAVGVCVDRAHRSHRRQLASEMPDGRLDPPLTLALDEAALICPIPLDSWTADMGGRNVTIHIAVQSRAQLRQRWGDVGAAAIINNAAILLVFGGARDVDDLTAYSTLTGDRDELVSTYANNGTVISKTTQRVPVLSEAQFAQLPPGQVVIIRRGMPPAIGRVQMAWKRHDVRTATRRAHRGERQRVRAVMRTERAVVWSRRAAWLAARAVDLGRAIVASIAAVAAGIERAEQAWMRREAKSLASRNQDAKHFDSQRATVGASEVDGGSDD